MGSSTDHFKQTLPNPLKKMDSVSGEHCFAPLKRVNNCTRISLETKSMTQYVTRNRVHFLNRIESLNQEMHSRRSTGHNQFIPSRQRTRMKRTLPNSPIHIRPSMS